MTPRIITSRSTGPADWAGARVKFYATSATRPIAAGLGWGGFSTTVVMPPNNRAATTEAFRAAVSRLLSKPARSASIVLGVPFGSGQELTQPIELSIEVQGLDDPRSPTAGVTPISAETLLGAVLQAYVDVFRPTNSGLSLADLRAAVTGSRRAGAYSANASEAPRFSYTGTGSSPQTPSGPTPQQLEIARQNTAAKSLNDYLRMAAPSLIYGPDRKAKANERVRQGQREMGMSPSDQDGKYGTRTRQRMELLGVTAVIPVMTTQQAKTGGTGTGTGGGGGGGGIANTIRDALVVDDSTPLTFSDAERAQVNAALQAVADTAKSTSNTTLIAVALGAVVLGGVVLWQTGFFDEKSRASRAAKKASLGADNLRKRARDRGLARGSEDDEE